MLIEINGKDVHSSYQHYFLQCYLQLLTSMGTDSLAKWVASCYYDDQILNQVDPAPDRGKNGWTLKEMAFKTLKKNPVKVISHLMF